LSISDRMFGGVGDCDRIVADVGDFGLDLFVTVQISDRMFGDASDSDGLVVVIFMIAGGMLADLCDFGSVFDFCDSGSDV